MTKKAITLPSIPEVPANVQAGLAIILLLALIVSTIASFHEFPWNGNPFTWYGAQESYKQGLREQEARHQRQAATFFREAVSIYPDDNRFQAAVGASELRLRRYAEAEQALKKAVALNIKDVRSWINLSTVYAIKGDSEEAEKTIHRALDAAPRDSAAMAQLGLLLAARGRKTEAAQVFEDAQHIVRQDAQYFSLKGRYLQVTGKLQESEGAFRQAVSMDPTQAEYAEWLGLCLMAQDRDDEAEKYLLGASQKDETNADYLEALGAVRMKEKHWKGAVEAFEKAVDLAPDNMSASGNLGICQFLTGDLEQAEPRLRHLFGKHPEDDAVRGLYYSCLLREHNFVPLEQSMTVWLAQEQQKHSPQLWTMLGDVYGFDGKSDLAKQAYQKALAANPPQAYRDYVEARIKTPATAKDLEELAAPLAGEPSNGETETPRTLPRLSSQLGPASGTPVPGLAAAKK